MFEDLKFHNDIKNHFLVKEYFNLKNKKYISKSDISLKKTNDFLSRYILLDKRNNKHIIMKKDLKKEFNKYKNLVYLKTKELERVSKENDLIPLMITLTLPSKFHPFKKINDKYTINKNFNFIELEERISQGYKHLNEIWRELYLNIKNNRKNKNMKMIQINEPHKSLQVHKHRILYINRDCYNSVEKTFNNIVKKYKLKQVKIEKSIISKKKNQGSKIDKLTTRRGSSYIIKYLLKNFQSEELKKFDGWKKTHKIRIFSMSNLELNTEFFKKLYYSNKDLNIELIKEIKRGKSKYSNLYQFYTENTNIRKTFIKKDSNGNIKIIKKEDNNKKGRFELTKIIEIQNKFSLKKIIKTVEKTTKTIEGLRDIYYSNKYNKFKEYYQVTTKEENHYLVKDMIYNITIFKEIPETINIKYYKNENFKIYDNELGKNIVKKDNFIMKFKELLIKRPKKIIKFI